jgi:hypothetical protein
MNMEVVQRCLAGRHCVVCYYNYEKLPAFESPQGATRARHPTYFFLFGVFGVATMLLQLYNIALLAAFWPFFAGIVYQLVTAMAQFARMILLLPE